MRSFAQRFCACFLFIFPSADVGGGRKAACEAAVPGATASRLFGSSGVAGLSGAGRSISRAGPRVIALGAIPTTADDLGMALFLRQIGYLERR